MITPLHQYPPVSIFSTWKTIHPVVFVSHNRVAKVNLLFYTWDSNTGVWERLNTTVDWNTRLAATQIEHLSIFALAGSLARKTHLPFITK
ncbi:MAG: hypothetical protein GYA34_03345 [Chloroflexi bacterium]|nr:hypothetical protein [Chloroflexota bacterium]